MAHHPETPALDLLVDTAAQANHWSISLASNLEGNPQTVPQGYCTKATLEVPDLNFNPFGALELLHTAGTAMGAEPGKLAIRLAAYKERPAERKFRLRNKLYHLLEVESPPDDAPDTARPADNDTAAPTAKPVIVLPIDAVRLAHQPVAYSAELNRALVNGIYEVALRSTPSFVSAQTQRATCYSGAERVTLAALAVFNCFSIAELSSGNIQLETAADAAMAGAVAASFLPSTAMLKRSLEPVMTGKPSPDIAAAVDHKIQADARSMTRRTLRHGVYTDLLTVSPDHPNVAREQTIAIHTANIAAHSYL